MEGRCINSLSLDKHGHLLALCSASGELLVVHPSSLDCTPVFQIDAAVLGFSIDRNTDEIYVTNRVEKWVMHGKLQNTSFFPGIDTTNGSTSSATGGTGVVSVAPAAQSLILFSGFTRFEGRSFIGPTGVTISPIDGEVFFTDGGCEGDTSLLHPSGAVYRTIQGRKHITTIAARGLQRPTGMAFSMDGCLFVCEQSANRLLRFVPRGGYYTSAVFAQFTGSLGPSAIAISPSRQRIYVSLYEPLSVRSYVGVERENTSRISAHPAGRIVVLNMRGEVMEEMETPGGPQLSALCIDSSDRYLYAAHADDQQCSSLIFCFELP